MVFLLGSVGFKAARLCIAWQRNCCCREHWKFGLLCVMAGIMCVEVWELGYMRAFGSFARSFCDNRQSGFLGIISLIYFRHLSIRNCKGVSVKLSPQELRTNDSDGSDFWVTTYNSTYTYYRCLRKPKRSYESAVRSKARCLADNPSSPVTLGCLGTTVDHRLKTTLVSRMEKLLKLKSSNRVINLV